MGKDAASQEEGLKGNAILAKSAEKMKMFAANGNQQRRNKIMLPSEEIYHLVIRLKCDALLKPSNKVSDHGRKFMIFIWHMRWK